MNCPKCGKPLPFSTNRYESELDNAIRAERVLREHEAVCGTEGIACPQCSFASMGSTVCPNCGFGPLVAEEVAGSYNPITGGVQSGERTTAKENVLSAEELKRELEKSKRKRMLEKERAELRRLRDRYQ